MRSLASKLGLSAAAVLAAAALLACRDGDESSDDAPPAAESARGGTAARSSGDPAKPREGDSTSGTTADREAASGDLPYLGATGIGVADLEKSFAFYTDVLGMSLRYEVQVPNYADEKILYFKDSKGADVVLMHFTDGEEHNYANNPVRLVFYVPDAMQLAAAIEDQGLEIVAPPTAQPSFGNRVIGLARDPDGYLLEIIEDQNLDVPYLSSVGIGVADLDASKDFYTRVMGMAPVGDLIAVPDLWDEWILRYPSMTGSGLVIFHYTDGEEHNYAGNPLKTVHFVEDSRAASEKVEKEGLEVLTPPTMFKLQDSDALISLVSDPDGYVVELITRQ